MILSNTIKIEITDKNLIRYKAYNKNLKVGDIHSIDINTLSPGSGFIIDLECDYCGQNYQLPYRKLLLSVMNLDKHSCKDCKSRKTKDTNLSKYGVENVMHLQENKDKIKETNLERYGVENIMDTDWVRGKIKQVNLDKYGVEYYSQTDECKDKIKETNLDRYGVENVMETEWAKEKLKQTNLERYGVEHIMQLEETKDKLRSTNLERYGVDSYTKTEEYKEKTKETNLERYGVEHPMFLDTFKDKIKETNLEKYGVEYYSQTDECKDKIKETNLERYGVEHVLSLDVVKEKIKQTNLDKYGVEYAISSEIIKQSIKDTNLLKYGVENVMQLDETKVKIKETNNERYGANHITQSEAYRKENFQTANHPHYIKYLEKSICLYSCDCGKEHNFEINLGNVRYRTVNGLPLCTICYPIDDLKSIKEKLLFEYIKSSHNGEIIQSYRDGLEIDIYLPDLKIGFEFNGIHWHSDKYRDNKYHLNKTNYFNTKGIRIIHIWEDDWDNKISIIKSQIKNWINKTENKIYARNCTIKEVSSKESKLFLNTNHIQGTVNSNLKLGLFLNDKLVSIMVFDKLEGRKRMIDGDWNISRFCNVLDTNVVGGSSKLLSYFITNYSPNRIISYADKDWSEGKLYETLNFTKISESGPDYKYILDRRRMHKSRFSKSKTGISESELDLPKVYDCGKIKYELKIKNK